MNLPEQKRCVLREEYHGGFVIQAGMLTVERSTKGLVIRHKYCILLGSEPDQRLDRCTECFIPFFFIYAKRAYCQI